MEVIYSGTKDSPVSVSVAVWTLVAISLERYFAICRPLSSRRWQTQFHAYKMIGLVWTVSFLANSPLCYVQRLQPVGRTTGQMKCREVWPDRVWEKAYVLFHDVGLLFLPLLTMGFAYSMIVSKLWRGLRHEIKHSSLYQQTSKLGTGGTGPSGGCVGTGGPAVGTGPGVTGTAGGEQHTHPTGGPGASTATGHDTGKPLKVCGTGTGKRHETGFVLTSSLKKGCSFKASTAVVNFASNNNTIGKGNFSSGNGGGSCGGITATNGAGTSGNPCSSNVSNGSNNGSNGAGGSNTDRTAGGLYCGGVSCECRTGRLRGFRHFFAKQQHQHGGLYRNHRYHLSSTSPEGLPELAETKFDETPAHQQHPYHHHCHHGHGYHHHHHHRMPTTIVKSTQQDAKHEIVLSTGEPGTLEPGIDGGMLPGTGSGTTNTTLGASATLPTVNPTTTTVTGDDTTLKPDPSYQFSRHAIRSTYMDKSIEAKKKVRISGAGAKRQYRSFARLLFVSSIDV
uniref:G_PROTEIN_RECEP_F1_2 domain-containing protein n=1 Tax=Anopheles funestus TaxID=62324 RepID=A0A182RP97_ANOFN